MTRKVRLIGHGAAGVEVGQKIRINGLEVTVASKRQAEEAEIVVCALAAMPTPFSDNLRGPCADCGDLLQWRPHAPKRPRKVCIDCGTVRINRSSV